MMIIIGKYIAKKVLCYFLMFLISKELTTKGYNVHFMYGKSHRNSPLNMKFADITFFRADPQLCFESLKNGLQTKNRPLVKQCIESLDYQLTKTTTLFIYYHLSFILHCITTYGNNHQPSAPQLVETKHEKNEQEWICWVRNAISELIHNCLLEIDKHAGYILQQEEFLKLPYEDILSVTTRNSLQVPNERLVYMTIIKWTQKECDRTGLPVKEAAKVLRYAARYGLMSKKEFESKTIDVFPGPKYSGLLEEKEWRKVLFYLKEKSKSRPVDELPYKGSQARIVGDDKPIELSSKSLARVDEVAPIVTYSKEFSTCERVASNIVTCWAAVFD